jgi:hypothetical protein
LPRPNWPIWPVGPTDLPAHLAHLAGLNQLARVWVGQTDPAQPSLAPLSHSRARWRPNHLRRRPAILAVSGDHHRRYLGRNTRPSVLFHLHQVIPTAASSPRRSMVGSRTGFHIGFASNLGISSSPSLMPAVLLRGDQVWVCTPVEAPFVVLPAVL